MFDMSIHTGENTKGRPSQSTSQINLKIKSESRQKDRIMMRLAAEHPIAKSSDFFDSVFKQPAASHVNPVHRKVPELRTSLSQSILPRLAFRRLPREIMASAKLEQSRYEGTLVDPKCHQWL